MVWKRALKKGRQKWKEVQEGKDDLPYVSVLPAGPGVEAPPVADRLRIATYNVHRWTGARGGWGWRPSRALEVIDELPADIIALQEVLRPADEDDPLVRLAAEAGFNVAFACSRQHRQGELGNAILSRWPLAEALAIDLTTNRVEQRSALAVEVRYGSELVSVVATHLALVDRTRARQVRTLLEHPHLQGPVILMGDMNAWRQGKASRQLDEAFTRRHHNDEWPASFPVVRPVLALDRAYVRHARLVDIRAHESERARQGSDHLPVVATVELDH